MGCYAQQVGMKIKVVTQTRSGVSYLPTWGQWPFRGAAGRCLNKIPEPGTIYPGKVYFRGAARNYFNKIPEPGTIYPEKVYFRGAAGRDLTNQIPECFTMYMY